jgi:hypothetical protein
MIQLIHGVKHMRRTNGLSSALQDSRAADLLEVSLSLFPGELLHVWQKGSAFCLEWTEKPTLAHLSVDLHTNYMIDQY